MLAKVAVGYRFTTEKVQIRGLRETRVEAEVQGDRKKRTFQSSKFMHEDTHRGKTVKVGGDSSQVNISDQ